MTRAGLDATTINALEAGVTYPLIFVELQLKSGTERLYTGFGTRTWGGNLWQGTGSLAQIDGVAEGIELTPYALRLGLSGVDATIVALTFDRPEWLNRSVICYLGSANAAGALVADPGIIFSGFIQDIEAVLASGEGDSVALVAESELVYFQRSRNLIYSDNLLQKEHPGDLGFQYLAKVATTVVVWRGRGINNIGDHGARPNDQPRRRQR